METTEIIATEGVIETSEEIVNVASGKGFKIAAGVGLVVLVGVVAYKYVAKPIIAKIKARKGLQMVDASEVHDHYDVDESESEEI